VPYGVRADADRPDDHPTRASRLDETTSPGKPCGRYISLVGLRRGELMSQENDRPEPENSVIDEINEGSDEARPEPDDAEKNDATEGVGDRVDTDSDL
jgi:hypothetical protein